MFLSLILWAFCQVLSLLWPLRPWNARIIGLDGLSPQEKAEAINIILLLPRWDREAAVPLDKEIALASLKLRLGTMAIHDPMRHCI